MTYDAVEERRNVFLIFATFVANLYLVAFGLDAIVTFFDTIFPSGDAPGPLREILTGVVVVGTFLVMPLLLLFVPHIPRRIFLPLMAFIFWAGLGAPPLPSMSDTPAAILGFAVAQVAFALYGFWMTSVMMDGPPWLMASRLPRKRFLVLRTVAAVLSLLLFIVVASPLFMVASVAAYLQIESKGYVSFAEEGVDLQETVLDNGTQKVRLIAMMHIGEPQFYRQLFGTFPAGSLVLSEGVSDRENRLAGNFSYQRVAEALGLARQPQLSEVTGAAVEEGDAPVPPASEKDATPAQPPQQPQAAKTTPDVVRADMDLSELSETSIRILMKTGELYASTSFNQAFSRYVEMNSAFTDEEFELFLREIVDKRNAHVLAEFDKRRADYDVIIIPWGGLHMPGLEEALIDRGFKIVSQEKRQVLKYQTIIDRVSKKSASSAKVDPQIQVTRVAIVAAN